MSIIMIACTDINGGLGNEKGELLFNLPKDMEYFKSVTTGKHVVMGRKTWDSLPKKPLPKRKNYILTKDDSFKVEGKTKVLNSVEEVLEMAKSKDVYICGGGEIYNQFMPHADKLIITHVHAIEISARSFFPEIDVREWKLTKASKNEADDKHAHSFTFATYQRKSQQEIISLKEESERAMEEAKQEHQSKE